VATHSDRAETLEIGGSERYRWRLSARSLSDSSFHENFISERLSALRGIAAEGALADKELLAHLPPWQTFKDMQKAMARVISAMESGERIVIFGDYDVDGTTSCALLKLAFADLGAEVEVYIPDRLTEGYGLNSIGLEKIAAAGRALVITVDNGISAVDACVRAKELGLDVIVTDHHEPPEVLPVAFALLNPSSLVAIILSKCSQA